LIGFRLGFGAALNYSAIDVDWDAIDEGEDGDQLSAKINLDINDISLYVRIRF
jgi:hypothetical protein